MAFTLNFVRLFLLDIFYASPVLLFLLALICTNGLIIAKIEGWSSFDGVYHARPRLFAVLAGKSPRELARSTESYAPQPRPIERTRSSKT
jgi:hypothetical protein